MSPDPKTLRAAGIVASWFGMLSDYHGIHFPVTINHIPQENAVIVGPASSLPETFTVRQAPTIATVWNPRILGKVLVITELIHRYSVTGCNCPDAQRN